jgi:trigger factor
MKITRENLGSKVKLVIEVEKDKLLKAGDEAFKKLSPSVKVSGFRPGKAPRNIVIREIGQDAFNSEILDNIIVSSYYDAVIQEKLDVVGAPEVKIIKFVPTDELSYEVIVEIMPEVKLAELSKINIKRESPKVTDKEVEEVLNDIAKQLAKTAKADRPSKMGDRVEIDFEGFDNGLPFDGGKSENHPFVLGEGKFVPGFEDQIAGMSEGEEKEIKVTFPKDYHSKNLAGRDTTFKIKMNLVEEVTLPEITDDFAKNAGPFTDLKSLKADIKKQLIFTKENEARKKIEDSIIEKLVEMTKLEVPESLVHQEIHRLLGEMDHNLTHSGLSMKQYLETAKKTEEELEKDLEPEAEKRVKAGLVLSQVAKDIEATASAEEVNTFIAQKTELYKDEEKKKAEEYFATDSAKRQIENAIIGQKVMDHLYKTCSK